MRFRSGVATAALLLICGSSAPLLAEQPPEPGTAEYYLAKAFPGWLAGAWVTMEDDRWTEEYWTGQGGKLLLGTGRSGKGDRVASAEQMRIAPDEAGLPVLWASPRGAKKPTPFEMTSAGPGEIMFENTDNDYPQRIHYVRQGAKLIAEISQADGTRARRWDYRLLAK
ncbi:MAG: DUF6265 family protein [Sphingobium sp.]|nr:DUF6265 family protein [Sphingobium sp.]